MTEKEIIENSQSTVYFCGIKRKDEVTGEISQEQYYSYNMPRLTSMVLEIHESFTVGILREQIGDKEVVAYYENNDYADKNFVVISCFIEQYLVTDTIVQQWIGRNANDAKEELTKKLLEYYKDTLGHLLQSQQVIKQELERAKEENKNLMDELVTREQQIDTVPLKRFKL